jgi:hypothetical protein
MKFDLDVQVYSSIEDGEIRHDVFLLNDQNEPLVLKTRFEDIVGRIVEWNTNMGTGVLDEKGISELEHIRETLNKYAAYTQDIINEHKEKLNVS